MSVVNDHRLLPITRPRALDNLITNQSLFARLKVANSNGACQTSPACKSICCAMYQAWSNLAAGQLHADSISVWGQFWTFGADAYFQPTIRRPQNLVDLLRLTLTNTFLHLRCKKAWCIFSIFDLRVKNFWLLTWARQKFLVNFLKWCTSTNQWLHPRSFFRFRMAHFAVYA